MKERHYFWFIIASTVVMTAFYCWLGYATAPLVGERILNSPDETANFYFTKIFAETGRLSVENPLPVELGPRAMAAVENKLVPGSFLGMIIIYGGIAKIFGSWIIIYLTPLFSIFAVLFFYKLIREIFDAKVAFVSSLLLLAQPAFWYYNARSMFHNVLFLDLIIIGFYWLAIYFKKASASRAALAGLFFCLALFVRTSEVLWLVPVLMALLLLNYKRIKVSHAIGVFVLLCFCAFVFFVFHKLAYGSFLTSGYGSEVKNFTSYLLPFGFHPRRALINLYHYFVQFVWWLAIPFIGGLISQLAQWKKSTKSQQWFLGFYAFMFLWLTIYYGSWHFKDNLSPAEVTIGTSYVRYWLPIYVFGLPLAAVALVRLLQFFKTRLVKLIATFILAAVFLLLSVQLTVTGTEESLLKVQTRISEYYQVRNKVAKLVPENSVVVAARHDKVFFPEFAVVAGLAEPAQFKALAQLAPEMPIYYYTFLNEADLAVENKKWQQYGLELVDGVGIFGRERLYRVIKKN